MTEHAPDSREDPPTFGEMLRLVANGETLGFVVVHKKHGISYRILDPGVQPGAPEKGETLVPMTSEEAQDLIDFIGEDSDELDERGTH